MQTLTLKVQDNILDKVIHFLNTFSKNDIEIVKTAQNVSDSNYLQILRDRHIKINKKIDINKITNEINDGLSYDSDFKKLSTHTHLKIKILH